MGLSSITACPFSTFHMREEQQEKNKIEQTEPAAEPLTLLTFHIALLCTQCLHAVRSQAAGHYLLCSLLNTFSTPCMAKYYQYCHKATKELSTLQIL